MSDHPTARPTTHSRASRWQAILALCLMALVVVIGIGHFTHTHPQTRQGFPAPDHCQLCVTTYDQARPSAILNAPGPVLSTHALPASPVLFAAATLWRFELACRPPPAASLIRSAAVVELDA